MRLRQTSRLCRKKQYKRHTQKTSATPVLSALRARMCCKNRTNGMSVVYVNVQHVLQKPMQTACRSPRVYVRWCCKNHYKRHQHRPHRCFRHFECRMCCKEGRSQCAVKTNTNGMSVIASLRQKRSSGGREINFGYLFPKHLIPGKEILIDIFY